MSANLIGASVQGRFVQLGRETEKKIRRAVLARESIDSPTSAALTTISKEENKHFFMSDGLFKNQVDSLSAVGAVKQKYSQ